MKLYSLAPVALAAVVCAYWFSAEDDLERLARELAEERRRSSDAEALHQCDECVLASLRQQLDALGHLLGPLVFTHTNLDEARRTELRDHAGAIFAGEPWSPPRADEHAGAPPNLTRLLDAAQALADWQERHVAGGPRLDDLIDELTAAREAMGEPPTRREGSSPPADAPQPRRGVCPACGGMFYDACEHVENCAQAQNLAAVALRGLTLRGAQSATTARDPANQAPAANAVDDHGTGAILAAFEPIVQVCRRGLAPAPPAVASASHGALRSAALAKLVEACRALRSDFEGGATAYSDEAEKAVFAALADLDDLRITPTGKVADPLTPVMPFGWCDLTSEQRSEVQAHVDGLRGIARPSGLPFKVVSTVEASLALRGIGTWCKLVDHELDALQDVLAHRDHLAARVAALQGTDELCTHQSYRHRGAMGWCAGADRDAASEVPEEHTAAWLDGWDEAAWYGNKDGGQVGSRAKAENKPVPTPVPVKLGDTAEEIAEADAWVRAWFASPAATATVASTHASHDPRKMRAVMRYYHATASELAALVGSEADNRRAFGAAS